MGNCIAHILYSVAAVHTYYVFPPHYCTLLETGVLDSKKVLLETGQVKSQTL